VNRKDSYCRFLVGFRTVKGAKMWAMIVDDGVQRVKARVDGQPVPHHSETS
jgi:hypothetical protein